MPKLGTKPIQPGEPFREKARSSQLDNAREGFIRMAQVFGRLLFAASLCLASVGLAQVPSVGPEPSAAPVQATDDLDRDTPRGAVTGLLKALAQRDFERAGLYLKPSDQEVARTKAARDAVAAVPKTAEQDMRERSGAGDAAAKRVSGEESDKGVAPSSTGSPAADTELPVQLSERAALARTLQVLLDRAGSLSEFTALSNRPEGTINDGLPADLEQIGVFRGKQLIPILLARDDDEETGLPVWRISRQTIADFERVVPPAVQQVLIDKAEKAEPGFQFRGAPLRDWIILLAIAFLCFFALYIVAQGILFSLRKTIRQTDRSRVYGLAFTVLPPLCLLLAVAAFQIITNRIEISIVAQQALLRYNGILGWIAVLWFSMRVVDSTTRAAVVRLEERHARQSKSVISLVERTAKLIILAFGVFIILDALGFDVTTGIAALGVGGLAFALGAQKTIENLVGSVTVIADKPVQIGDFCEVAGVKGFIEDIGIRSTRIRTLERTLVSIPNADLASQQIENLSARDRFRFAPLIRLEHDTGPKDVRHAISMISAVLAAQPGIDQQDMRVLLADFGDGSLDIEVHSYILVGDYVQSRCIRHNLLIDIHQRLSEAGIRLAEKEPIIRIQTDRNADVIMDR